LRREFQQLELLNAITTLRFEGILPDSVQGDTRTALIRSFQQWKGVEWCPPNVHRAIRWSKVDPLGLTVIEPSSKWQMVANRHNTTKKQGSSAEDRAVNYVPAHGTSTLSTTHSDPFNNRRFRNQLNSLPQPIGLRWDAASWSCAYDALLSILHLIYSTNSRMWLDEVANSNDHLRLLTDGW
ncbi:uncharacterized protein STEHIDRAFT_40293, partial [Stereum hirsutum FP-91666 SS1]